MRQRAPIPSFFSFRVHEDGSSTIAFLCSCGEANVRTVWAHVSEAGSSAEVQCPACKRYIQLRASRVH